MTACSGTNTVHALRLASQLNRIEIVQSMLTLSGVCEGRLDWRIILDCLMDAVGKGHHRIVRCFGAELQRIGIAMDHSLTGPDHSLLDCAFRGLCDRDPGSSVHSYLLVMRYFVEIGLTTVNEVLPAHHLHELIRAHFDWQRKRAYDKHAAATYHEIFDLLVNVGNCSIKDITDSVHLGLADWVRIMRPTGKPDLRILLAAEHYLKFLTTSGVDIQDLKFPNAAPATVLAIQIAQQELWKTINALGEGITLGQLKELACEQKLDFDGRDKAGQTLLHVVRYVVFQLFCILVSRHQGRPRIERLFAFSQAAVHDRRDVIEWLVLERGVDLHQRTRDDASAVQIAKQSGSTHAMACLQRIDATRVIGSFMLSHLRWREARRLKSERYNAVVRIQSMCRSRAQRNRKIAGVP